MPAPARLAVLLSGTGRSLENLLGVIARGELDAEVVLVVGSGECRGVRIAREHSISTQVIGERIAPGRLDGLVRTHAVDWIVLAGYLKLLPITDTTRGRVVNIHPALLPAFGGPGMHGMKVHRAVLSAAAAGKVSESGCTVHLCDDRYDTGPIVLQRRCPVLAGDTPQTLGDRVFALECEAYPEAIRMLICGNGPGDLAEEGE